MLDPHAPPARPLAVLVVEDNIDSQYLCCEMLKAYGFHADGVGHAEDALALLGAGDYHVLFADIGLPGMSGVELARLALARQPALRVIFSSGYGDSLLRHVAFAHQSLQKPFDIERLHSLLEAIDAERGNG
jgi:CheY-like chemotaxis protein